MQTRKKSAGKLGEHKTHERTRINHSIGWGRWFCRIFLNFGRGGVKYLTVCLPLARSLLTRRNRSRCHFCLSANYSRVAADSSHGSIYRRGIDVSISLRLSLYGNSPNALRASSPNRRRKIDGDQFPMTLFGKRRSLSAKQCSSYVLSVHLS